MIKHDKEVAALRAEGLDEWRINFTMKHLLDHEELSTAEKLKIIALLATNTIKISVQTGEIKDMESGMKDFLEHLETRQKSE